MCSNEDQIAILLIYAKANVNSRNNDDSTPLMAAAMYNHTEVLKVLVSHPDIDLNLRVSSIQCIQGKILCEGNPLDHAVCEPGFSSSVVRRARSQDFFKEGVQLPKGKTP